MFNDVEPPVLPPVEPPVEPPVLPPDDEGLPFGVTEVPEGTRFPPADPPPDPLEPPDELPPLPPDGLVDVDPPGELPEDVVLPLPPRVAPGVTWPPCGPLGEDGVDVDVVLCWPFGPLAASDPFPV